MTSAGVSSDSRVTRDSAGWMRWPRCSKCSRCAPGSPARTTISPSRAIRSGRCSRQAATTSGKYRVSGFLPRLASSTSSPSLRTMQRKPSHFGS